MNDSLEQIDISLEEELEIDGVPTLEDFMRELEEREQKLEISSFSVDEDKHAIRKVSKAVQAHHNETPVRQHPNEVFEKLNLRVSELEKDKEEFISTMRRRQVDFDSFKKRIEREKSEAFQVLASNIARQILPVLDNLDRALQAANSQNTSQKSAEFENFVAGILLVNDQIFEVLAEMGVESIPTIGAQFDPHFHEAVAIEPSSEVAPQTVIAELLRGYKIGSKVIRASMVKVSS
jgi:molecular chaperone GrpE